MTQQPYDALLLLSFGGPEGPDDVLPFLDNVLRGRNVPEARKLEVAEHYYRFGGVSPINQQNRELLEALRQQLSGELPVYWGNRNWHPLIGDTVAQMARDGIRHALIFITSAFRSYSGCRQYLDAMAEATASFEGDAPRFSKLRAFYNHPRFVEAWCDRTRDGLSQFADADRPNVKVLFTAHSIPNAMANASPYVEQLNELADLIAARVGIERQQWQLVYQSRSGPPHQPWLEPDVCDVINALGADGVQQVLVVPIGFLSDHIEVLFDLDVEAADAARQAGMEFVRVATLGTHPEFVKMACDLARERTSGAAERPALGTLGPAPDECPPDCCRYR